MRQVNRLVVCVCVLVLTAGLFVGGYGSGTVVREGDSGASVVCANMVQCPTCHGSGAIRCPVCKAQGKVRGKECGTCRGSKKIVCPTCGGVGKVKK